MSSVDDLSQVNYLTTSVQPSPMYSVRNYATLGLAIAGTITTGTFTVEASVDGNTWDKVPVAQGNVQLADDTIIAAGGYTAGVAGYSLARLVPDSFTGQVQVTANISTRITPPFMVGFA